jgi:hypothetical protein
MASMTTDSNPRDNARAALPTYLANWRHKHGLSGAEAQQIIMDHMQREMPKRNPKTKKPLAKHRGVPEHQLAQVRAEVRRGYADLERLAQTLEGHARVAREREDGNA